MSIDNCYLLKQCLESILKLVHSVFNQPLPIFYSKLQSLNASFTTMPTNGRYGKVKFFIFDQKKEVPQREFDK